MILLLQMTGQVDVDIYSGLAEEFGVSKDPASFDLPTLILFQKGREIRRLPELTVNKEGSVSSTTDSAKDAITRLGWSKKPVMYKDIDDFCVKCNYLQY